MTWATRHSGSARPQERRWSPCRSSAGTTSRDDLPPITLSVICEQLADQGVLLVAAAGNDGNTEAFYPAYFSVADDRIGRPANPNVV